MQARLPLLVLTAMATIVLASPRLMAQQNEQRPSAMALFPRETVLFIRTAEARELIERAQQTSLPKMMRDPALADFVGSLEDSARDAFAEQLQEALGVDFDSMLNLPQGEVAFGVVERQNEDPAVLFLADFREEAATAEALLEEAKEQLVQDGGSVAEEQFRADKVVTFRPSNDQSDAMGVARREGVFVVASDPALLASVLDRWDGVDPVEEQPATEEEPDAKPQPPRFVETLDKNRAFASSLRECLQGRDEPPQLVAFVDPIGFVRAVSGRQTGVRIALATLPALGVDAVEGASGALWMATENWDSLLRGHLLIDNPRTAVVRLARLGAGDMPPPQLRSRRRAQLHDSPPRTAATLQRHRGGRRSFHLPGLVPRTREEELL